MKPRLGLLLPLLLITNVHVFAAVPDRPEGYIYYESGRTTANSFYELAQTFAADGTCSQIFFRSSSAGAQGPNLLKPPSVGTYVYRKRDEFTAELALTGSVSSDRRTLRFTSETAGSVTFDGFAIVSASFRLAPLSDRSPLANCSNRSTVGADKPAFTGFVITGETTRTVLVRAVGPGLAPFAVADFLRNPALNVVRAGTGGTVGINDDWSSENAESVSRTSAAVGAFPLPAASKDAALILTLAPGAYIAQVNSPDTADSGQALIEVYILP